MKFTAPSPVPNGPHRGTGRNVEDAVSGKPETASYEQATRSLEQEKNKRTNQPHTGPSDKLKVVTRKIAEL